MEPSEHWRQVYETKRPEEVSWFQASPMPSLDALGRIGMAPRRSLIDIGGGASSLVDALLDRGWRDVTVLDIADTALKASKARLGLRAGTVHWETADIRMWSPARAYDIWHDRAVFHFLTEAEDRAAYRQALLHGTHPGSHIIMATFGLDGPETCSGLPVCRYDAGGLTKELASAFTLVAEWQEEHHTPWEAEQRFQWTIFRRV